MKAISYLCFTLALVSIVSGTTIAIQAIWIGLNPSTWKGLMTCGVLFLASALTASINHLIAPGKNQKE